MYLQGYLNYLSKEEKQVLEGYEDFIKDLQMRAANPREMFMRERHLNERQRTFRRIIEREDGRRFFDKIVIFGDSGVGKNTLHQKFLTNIGPDTRLTMGINMGVKDLSVNDHSFRLGIWNIASNQIFNHLRTLYFRGKFREIIL